MHQPGRLKHPYRNAAHFGVHPPQVRHEMLQLLKVPDIFAGADFNLIAAVLAHVYVSNGGRKILWCHRFCIKPAFQLLKCVHYIAAQLGLEHCQA